MYKLTQKWQELKELKGSIWNKSNTSDVLLTNAVRVEDIDEDNVIIIKSGEVKSIRASLNKVFARTVRGTANLAVVEGLYSQNSDSGGEAEVPEEVLRQVNENSSGIASASAQLQSCVHKIEDVVNVISPQGIGEILADNAINLGGNVIEGDNCGFIYDKENKRFYIGQGYTNTHDNTVTYATWSELNLRTTVISDRHLRCDIVGGDTGSKASNYITTKLRKLTAGKTYIISFDYKKSHDDITALLRFGGHEIPNLYGNIGEGQKSNIFKRYNLKITPTADTDIGFYPAQGGEKPIGAWIELKNMQVAEVQNNVPFVLHSFKGGRLSYNGYITSQTHTIIETGILGNIGATIRVLTGKEDGYIGETEFFEIPSSYNDGRKFDIIVTKDTAIGIREDGLEFSLNKGNLGVSKGFLWLGGHENLKVNWIKDSLVFIGNLGEAKAREILTLLKNGNYTLEQNLQGAILPIENMTRRNDNYGIVKEHIEATVDRDLWHASEEGLYHIINKATLQESYARVNEDLSITGDLEDVSGRLRVLYDCYIRKVS